ncbi:MAG: hypothetical protein C5B57_08980 [Blastocatellia bacterium]|nr:MAG: hypothetical protein C5B57_08980 [Blastocatellia bacterium]
MSLRSTRQSTLKTPCVLLSVALISTRILALTVAEAATPQLRSSAPDDTTGSEFRTALDRYCVTCHNQRAKTAGLMFDTMDLGRVADYAEVWEKVVRKLRTGLMPPEGMPRPNQTIHDALIVWLETTLDRAAAAKPNPGRSLLHRLNRAEYANAIRDLLALEIDTASLLPPDDSSYGFDNIAEVLGLSPVLLERYLAAARKISALAVGDPTIGPGFEIHRARQDLTQTQHIEGLPLGTVGGLLVRPTLPLDGEYQLEVKLFRTNLNVMRGLEYQHQVEITVDGQRVHLAKVGGEEDFVASQDNPTLAADAVDARLKVRLRLKAGPRTIGAAFLQRTSAQDSLQLRPFLRSSADTVDPTGRPHIDTLTIAGPFNPTGAGDTPSRRKIFTCHPASLSDEARCARRIITTLARRAYRGAVTDADLQRLFAFYESGRSEGSFETGIAFALRRILASPNFVYRAEHDPADAARDSVYRISDLELASRLSFFLWSSIPDDELLAAADQRRLQDPEVLEAQVRRMLADTRAQAFVSNFAGQWLFVRNLRTSIPNSDEFPDFDDNLRQAFQRETELFFDSIMREDRSVLDFITANYTFVNERLARHYGVLNVYGSHFRRVMLTDEARRGLLGKGSTLLVTSRPTRTSPVLRGKWILENLLGAPPPPPPPDVPPFPENNGEARPRSVRQRMEEHRLNPACASCHKLMDPLGFALENFDAVGAWRTQDEGTPIDPSSELADGTKLDGPAALRQVVLKQPDVFVSTLTEKLMTYALGRGVTYSDQPAVRAIVRESREHDYRFSSLILGIVRSTPFQMRKTS